MTKTQIDKLAAALVKANLDIGDSEYVFHGEPHTYKKALTKKQIVAIIKSANIIMFTRAELEDLERLTAGTSEEWCQRLNAKFEEALGIKTVKVPE